MIEEMAMPNIIMLREKWDPLYRKEKEIRKKKDAITRSEALSAFSELRRQAASLPEISLNEINSEIEIARAERRTRS